ncbi:MAG: hypothetical protein JXB50_01830 [Spirochaetes bacterium]|nr:hypothetical protein [Spirochaetota bacterium]
MKISPLFKKAYDNMRPGRITMEGFLGDDERTLTDIISEDEKEVKFLKMDFEIISSKLKYFLNEGLKGLGEPLTVDKKWLVRVDEARGRLPCPFEDKIVNKKTVYVKNVEKNLDFFYSDLSIHLIEAHHFFEGKGSTFRLEPSLIKQILEI